jgi:ATP-binding cassette subfamily B protein
VAAQPLIRAYGLEEDVKAQFAKKQGRGNSQPVANRAVRFKQTLQGAPFLMSMVVVLTDTQQVILNGLVIGIGAFLAVSGTITVGALLAFVAFLGQLKPAMASLLAYFRDLVWAAAAVDQLEMILTIPAEVAEMSPARDLPRLSREIRFEEVSFSYGGQEPQLKLNTFSIPATRLTAIVGRSSAGKSTLLRLLLRFYDPAEGRVLLDGYDLRTVSQTSFRSQIGVVFQDIILLNATIRENICIVKPDATDEEIEAAARAAGIHETVMELPEGYLTLVGERGSHLALGQRQRISLARALLADPALLLLDEVTSALDPESEAAINTTLRKLARDRTVIAVTHRLTAVMEMDEVIGLDGGYVVEQGQH